MNIHKLVMWIERHFNRLGKFSIMFLCDINCSNNSEKLKFESCNNLKPELRAYCKGFWGSGENGYLFSGITGDYFQGFGEQAHSLGD